MPRNFKNRRFKNGTDFIIFEEDNYTENEYNITIKNSSFAVTSSIKKTELKRFAKELLERSPRVFSDKSSYDSHPFFLAELQEQGYKFTVKSICQSSVFLPFEKVDKLIFFLHDVAISQITKTIKNTFKIETHPVIVSGVEQPNLGIGKPYFIKYSGDYHIATYLGKTYIEVKKIITEIFIFQINSAAVINFQYADLKDVYEEYNIQKDENTL